jgi:hypothetical protein
MRRFLIILFLLILVGIALTGCITTSTTPSSKPLTSSTPVTIPSKTPIPIPTKSEIQTSLSKVAYYRTNSGGYDSDNDNDADSIIITPILIDSNGKPMTLSGISMPMDIKIRNTLTEKGHIMPKYKTDLLYGGTLTVTSSPNQKSIISLKNLDFKTIQTYKDSYGVYQFVINSDLYLPDGRTMEYEELVTLTRWNEM